MDRKHSYLVVFWSPFPVSEQSPLVRYFASFLREYGDIRCLDLQNDYDPRTFRVLRQADLVVITLHQDYRELCRLFCTGRIRFPNCVYLITDYVAGDSLALSQIRFEFRIPTSRLGCIPYNPRLWETEKWPDAHLFPADYRRELKHAGQIMLLALGF